MKYFGKRLKSRQRVWGVMALVGALVIGAWWAGPVQHKHGMPQEPSFVVATWEDVPNTAQIKAVVALPPVAWKPAPKTSLSLGLTRSAYWIRINAHIPAAGPHVLHVGFPSLDEVDVYFPQAGGTYVHMRAGDHVPLSQRVVNRGEPVFPLALPAGSYALYLRVASQSTALIVPIHLHTQETYLVYDHTETRFYGVYYGIFLVMVLYNLFLFYSLWDVEYLAYVLFIATFGSYQAVTSGIASEILWPNTPWYNDRTGISLIAAACATGIWFTLLLLQAARYSPRWAWVMRVLMALDGLMAVLVWGMDPLNIDRVMYGLAPLSVLMCAGTGLRFWWLKRDGPARYYVEAVVVLTLGGVTYGLMGAGLVPVNSMTLYSMPLGSAAMVVLFSLALADRINQMQQEKEAALLHIRDHAERLEENLLLREEVKRRLEVEKTLRQAKEEAEAATRLKDKFVALVAHDLRAPFSSILPVLRLLSEDTAINMDSEHREMLSQAQARGQMAIQMVTELLNINRLQTGHLKPQKHFFSAHLLVAQAIQAESDAEKKGIRLENQVSEKLKIYADRGLLLSVMQNLLHNAIKFTPQGGQVKVFCPPDEPFTLAVADTGVGMAPDVLSQLFLHTENISTKGTAGEIGVGLGLALAYEIMVAHEGKLRAVSMPGQGSTFYATLPAQFPVGLVAHPEAQIRALAKEVFVAEGMQVVEVADVTQAYQAMLEQEPHVILTAWMLPGGGAAAIKKITEDLKLTVQMMTSATPTMLSEVSAEEVAAVAQVLLTEPWTPQALKEALGRLVWS